ncbi:MAG: sugar ABC transporter substrate-binding protein [Spirochaetales bacterium]|nr:sugar ABC transporter substrate-binding protein [Spirochaetales bacterium]
MELLIVPAGDPGIFSLPEPAVGATIDYGEQQSVMKKAALIIILPVFLLGGIFLIRAAGQIEPDKNSIDPASSAFNWKSRSGSKLNVMFNLHPWVEIIEPLLPEFERLTGIDVQISIYPEDQLRAKRKIEMVSGVSDVDVYMIMPGHSLTLYERSGWVTPLDDFMDNPILTNPDFRRDDFFPAALEAGRRHDSQYVIPILMETSLLAYNREILAEYGIDNPPATLDELEAVSRKIHNESKGEIYGITMRGKKASATSQWIDFLRGFGGDWLEGDRSGMGTQEAILATAYYGRLLRLYGPKSAPSNGWYESISIFMEGRAAMIYDASVFKIHYEDGASSRIAGKVGYSLIPAGPAGTTPHISTWGLSIYSGSENREAAWLLIQWLTNEANSLQALLNGIPAARSSVWENEAFISHDTTPQWTQASKESYALASPYWNPPVADVDSYREAVGSAIVESILGNYVATACHVAEALTNSLLEKEP